jgi:uncharacterized iron-regulated membrane protein
MKLRKLIFWLHLIAGVFAGAVVLIMSVTGVALMYQKQVTAWADRREYGVQPLSSQARLPINNLIARFRDARPDASPTAITMYADSPGLALVAAGQGQNLYINTYTGEVLGPGSESIRKFFRTMTDWHRYLGMTESSRTTGKAITGACNIAFLFIVVSGFYLWWPAKWTRQSVRSVTWFRKGLSGKPRDFNWHNVFGFWSAIPLFLVVVPATVISYPWASNLAYRVAGSLPPQQAARNEARPQRDIDLTTVDSLLLKVQGERPGWRNINLRFPSSADKGVAFSVDEGNGGQPQLRSSMVLNKAEGSIIETAGFNEQTAGQRFRSWLRFVHTGEFYGVPGQTVAGLASAAAVMLVCTGFALGIRRFWAWISRNRRRDESENGVLAVAGQKR